jgi:predicted nucleic acid-binding protein
MIVDASVAVKWFLPEEELESEAQLVRYALLDERISASAPSILWSEVAHAIVGAVRQKRFAEEQAKSVTARFHRLRAAVELTDVDVKDAIDRALKVGIGAYDAQYLSLAAQLDESVITADRRLLERGRAHGYDVVWLGDVTLRDGVLVDTPQGYQDEGVTLPYE